MLAVTGDLWKYAAGVSGWVVVPTNCTLKANGELVMGTGMALQAAQRYPGLPLMLGEWVRGYGCRPCAVHRCSVIALPTKLDWRQPAHISLVIAGAWYLQGRKDEMPVVLPRLGCGLGGLKWEDVGPRLSGILDDRFTVVEEKP